MKQLSGCGTALVTPFKNNGQVDYLAFERLVARQVDAGIDFLVPLGTTGEASCLTATEKLKLLEITLATSRGKPVIAGATSNNTQEVVETVRSFDQAGASGFLIAAPYYNKPNFNGLLDHFENIASATSKPIVLYNVPSRTSVNLPTALVLKLSMIKNIVAIKEASSNYQQISEIIRQAPPGFSVLSGNDEETLSLMATGARGVISVASNIIPKQLKKMVDLLLQEKLVKARKLHFRYSELFINCFIDTNPIMVKAFMHRLGLLSNVLRLPLVPAARSTNRVIESTIEQLRAAGEQI